VRPHSRRAYGSTKRYKSMDRVVKVNQHTVLGAGGEISDFQYIQVRACRQGWVCARAGAPLRRMMGAR